MTTAVEITEFVPKAGMAEQFNAAFCRALPILARQQGVLANWFGPTIEDTGSFFLVVEWASLKDHTEKFRGSADFEAFVDQFRPLLHRLSKVVHILQHAADRPPPPGGRDA